MQKLNKIILSLILFCSLFFSSLTIAQESVSLDVIPVQTEDGQTVETLKVHDLEIEPIDTNKVKKNVVPDSKKEAKKVVLLFFKTMLGVVICAFALYFILLFVRKYYGNSFTSGDVDDYEELSLSNPENKQDALKIFLNRSK